MKLLKLSFPWLTATDSHPVSCCLCEGVHPAETLYSFELNGVSFIIERCTVDDLMYLAPQPGTTYAEELYNHPSYFGEANDMYGHFVDQEKGKATGAIRAEEMIQHGGLPKRFLEIGSGLGYTLEAVREKGVEVVGVEFSEESVTKARKRNLDVFQATLETVIPQEVALRAPYEVIAIYSVLEHVPNPLHFLEQIVPLLAPNGRLLIRVPSMSKEGPWLSLLDHYWHFTSASLEHLLKLQKLAILTQFPSGAFVAPSSGEKLYNMTFITTPSK